MSQLGHTGQEIQDLREQIASRRRSLAALEDRMQQLENGSLQLDERPFTAAEYKRYGRQMILPQIGGPGQSALKSARVLIVGLGGLGCPAAAYLAGAGIGTLGLVDGDDVELSNLHRQIAHRTHAVGTSKVLSAYDYLRKLNPLVQYKLHQEHLTPGSAISLFAQYDLVLDCTDHPTTRYLISDTCVLTERTLVSASALKTEGQLIVLNNPAKPAGHPSGGPCYRCIFPKPPPAETVVNCGEGGILGPVVGAMGVLQALEAIKAITADTQAKPSMESPPKVSMLIFSAYGEPQFRTIKMRSRRPGCIACSAGSTITKDSLQSGSLNYAAFCGVTMPQDILPPASRVSATTFSTLRRLTSAITIDVRDITQFNICSLPESINIPWNDDVKAWQKSAAAWSNAVERADEIYLICRLGNDSQLAATALQEGSLSAANTIKDVKGGFRAWREEVDHTWPDY